MINTYVMFYYTAKDLFILENQILCTGDYC